MQKNIVLIYFIFLSLNLFAQEELLPNDLRPHLLTQFNASLLNPTYALTWNNPRSFSVWTRWQSQNIDDSPTTTFINYTHGFTPEKVAGIGFLQNNTGLFLNTGGILNYAQIFAISEKVNIALGTNLYVFQQELANINFLGVDGVEDRDEYIAQISPGIRLNINNFNLALSLENAINFNFTESQLNNGNRIFTGVLSNDFYFSLFSSGRNSFIRPIAYVRTIPDFDTQYGGNLLLSTPNFWLQGGYNSFYGPSGGAGLTLFEKLSLGGMVEYPTNSNEILNRDTTFELVASYHFGKAKPAPDKKKEEEEEALAALEKKEEEEKAKVKALEEEKSKLLEDNRLLAAELTRKQDSITAVKENELAIAREKQRLDSIAKVTQTKEVELLPNEKYEEVTSTNVDGLEPGFYLIANVFGTKRYFQAFLKTLREKGLNPKSFYRSSNTYNYVYLERYNTIQEARKARDSRFVGRYNEKTWIFRVR